MGRLRVTQRLALLVLVPLLAVVGLAIPVVIQQAAQARAVASIAEEAQTRRTVGGLLEELQRERLISLVYLALPGSESLAVVRQSQAVNDAIEDVRVNADPRLQPGVARLKELLGVVRPRVLDRSVLSYVAHYMFTQAVESVLETLPPPTASGTEASVPPVGALDELLRANEHAARLGAGVLVTVSEQVPGQRLVADAKTAQQVHTARFVQLATGAHRVFLVQAENSQAATRINEFVDIGLPAGDRNTVVGRIAAAVETYTTLRRLVGDRIAREIVAESASDAATTRTTAIVVGILALLLLVLVAGLAAAGARSIAVPLARLNVAAIAVAAATGRELERVSDVESDVEVAPSLPAVPTSGPGDVADLAAAFNQVQEGAAGLLARQLTTRRNVSAMFATVARRTRNLADRQLNLIDVLERQQQDPQLLERLYRLDHVATRLRRSASALLVVSGAADDTPGQPMRIADVVRAAAAEIEQFTRVQLVEAVDVAAVPSVAPDLILLVAELLDNAVSYSPPPSPVEVTVSLSGGGCRMSISDTGIGMSDDQLDAENRRLVERERLDIAPTQVLGLFVVGRLARRHGLEITLGTNRPTGITVHIDVPGRLLTASAGPTAPAPTPRGVRQAARRPAHELPVPHRAMAAMRAIEVDDGFSWFGSDNDAQPALPAQPAAPALPAAPDHTPEPAAPDRSAEPAMPAAGAAPTVPAQRRPELPAAAPPVAPVSPAPAAPVSPAGMPLAPPWRGPVVPAAAAAPPQVPAEAPPLSPIGPRSGAAPSGRPELSPIVERSGLSRRIPGRNLPPGALPPAADRDSEVRIDPAAARAEAEAFTAGFERGSATGVAAVPGPGATRDEAMRFDPAAARAEAEAFTAGFERGSTAGYERGNATGVAAVPPAPAPVAAPPQWPLPAPATPAASAAPAAPAGHPAGPGAPAAGATGRAPVPAPQATTPVAATPAAAPAQPTAQAPPVPEAPPLGGETTQPLAQPAAAPPAREPGLTRRVPGAHLAEELRLPGRAGPAVGRAAAVPPAAPMPSAGPVDRDPAAEQRALDMLVAGFARGEAAVQPPSGRPPDYPTGPPPDYPAGAFDQPTAPNGRNGAPPSQPQPHRNGVSGQNGTPQDEPDFAGDPSPTYPFNSGVPAGPEPQNVERR
jgi:signal transduction histidine kinase